MVPTTVVCRAVSAADECRRVAGGRWIKRSKVEVMETIALATPPVVSGAIPLLGHLTEFGRDRTGLIDRGYKEHGCVFTVKLGPQNVAVLLGPEHHRTFFMETDKTLNIATPYKFLRATFGEVFFMAGHEE